MNILARVDPGAGWLTKEESVALHMMKDKHQRYVAKGRTKEAHGIATGVLILWQALQRAPIIDTGWGEPP